MAPVRRRILVADDNAERCRPWDGFGARCRIFSASNGSRVESAERHLPEVALSI